MMRLAPLAIVVSLICATAADARLFWQTYGATVPTGDGGCAWNINQDYFVPRYCGSGAYGLFSACKTSHYISPACKYLHPIYDGYCTPYGPCRYHWRDCVYKHRCCCTPLADSVGGWHVTKCRKHCFALQHPAECGCEESNYGLCASGRPALAGSPVGEWATDHVLPNVEPLGGEHLGSVAAFPGMAGGGGTAGGAGLSLPMAIPGAAAAPAAPVPGLNSTQSRVSTGVVSVPLAPGF